MQIGSHFKLDSLRRIARMGLATMAAAFHALTATQAAIHISEIHYHSGMAPASTDEEDTPDLFEFIEIYNSASEPMDLSGCRFSDGIFYDFPPGVQLAPGSFAIVAKDPESFESEYGFDPDFGPFDGQLNNGGERLTLTHPILGELVSVRYRDHGDWPAAADGAGHSIVYEDFGQPLDQGRSWKPSLWRGGSPGDWDRPSEDAPDILNLIGKGSPLLYFKGTMEPSNGTTEWAGVDFQTDENWLDATSGVGYSSSSSELAFLSTVLEDMRGRYVSVYTRFSFNVGPAQLERAETLTLNHAYDDGYVIYLNGTRVASANVPGTPPAFDQIASTGSDYPPVTIDLSQYIEILTAGQNVLAIQGHNVGLSNSSDFVIAPSLEMQLVQPDPQTEPWRQIVINEIQANSSTNPDFIEIFNPTADAIDLSGFHLSDSESRLDRFTIPQGTSIEPGGFIHFTGDALGFGLSSLGEKIFFTRPQMDAVAAAYAWGEQLQDVALTRYPDGSPNWFYTRTPSPQAPAPPPERILPVVLSEIHYHDPEGERFEFVEIASLDAENSINISDWHFIGIDSRFADGTSISPQGTVVVADDVEFFRQRYGRIPGLSPDSYGGGLQDNGEPLLLQDKWDVIVDIADFDNNAPWPLTPDGFGASLDRTCVLNFPSTAGDWSASTVDGPNPASATRLTQCDSGDIPPVRITEIHYNPNTPGRDPRSMEFIELTHEGGTDLEVSGWMITGDIRFVFPEDTILSPGERVVLAWSPEILSQILPTENSINVFGPYSGELTNGGGMVAVVDSMGRLVDAVDYEDDFPWPSLADGFNRSPEPGLSLTRIEDSDSLSGSSAWTAATPSPGLPSPAHTPDHLNYIQSLSLNPEQPGPDDSPTLTIEMAPGFTPASVSVEFFADDLNSMIEDVTTIQASQVTQGTWECEFPAFAPSSVIRYAVKSTLESGETIRSPGTERDQFEWHGWFVDPRIATPYTNQFHLFISPINWRRLHAWTDPGRVLNTQEPNPNWNNEVPAVFVSGGQVYDVMVRHQGSRWNRRNGATIPFDCQSHNSDGTAQVRSWRIDFPSYRRHRGQDVLIIQKQRGWPQKLSFELFKQAGVPAPDTTWADLRINGCSYNPDAFVIERPGEDMVEKWFDSVGDLFKSQGYTGNEGPWSWGDERLIRGSLNGFTQSQRYKYTYDRKTHTWRVDKDSLEADLPEQMIEGLHAARSQGRQALRQFLLENFDINLTLRYICLINYVGTFDDMFQNHFIYRQADTGLWCMFPWDMDVTLGGAFGEATAHPFRGVDESWYGQIGNRSGWWNRLKDSFFIAFPEEFQQMFYFLNNTSLHPDNLGPLIESVAIEGNTTGSINSMNNHVRSRHSYLKQYFENSLNADMPLLDIARAETRIELSWSGSGLFNVLQAAQESRGPWINAMDGVEFDGSRFRVQLRPEFDHRFFRLRSQP